jgi:hypothetical protein
MDVIAVSGFVKELSNFCLCYWTLNIPSSLGEFHVSNFMDLRESVRLYLTLIIYVGVNVKRMLAKY